MDDGTVTREALDAACRSLAARWREVVGIGNAGVGWDVRMMGGVNENETLLRISRPLHIPSSQPYTATTEESVDLEANDEEGEEVEDDEAALPPPTTTATWPSTVEYTIHHSPSYQVPVLYFHLHNLPPTGPRGLDAVYEFLVPRHQRDAIQEVGVLGGVSMTVGFLSNMLFGTPPEEEGVPVWRLMSRGKSTAESGRKKGLADGKGGQNHPVTDLPCFWVHPCNTVVAMGELVKGLGAVRVGRKGSAEEEYLMLWLGLVGGAVGLYLPKELVAVEEASA